MHYQAGSDSVYDLNHQGSICVYDSNRFVHRVYENRLCYCREQLRVHVDIDTDDYLLFVKIPLGKMTAKEAKQTEQEASLLARLDHPNIVAFWESFVNGSNLYIVMEFANGKAHQRAF